MNISHLTLDAGIIASIQAVNAWWFARVIYANSPPGTRAFDVMVFIMLCFLTAGMLLHTIESAGIVPDGKIAIASLVATLTAFVLSSLTALAGMAERKLRKWVKRRFA